MELLEVGQELNIRDVVSGYKEGHHILCARISRMCRQGDLYSWLEVEWSPDEPCKRSKSATPRSAPSVWPSISNQE
jgi:hypothetical protein